MADAIKAGTGQDVKLIPGSGGIFDVEVDGRMIYSKHQTGRFPDHDEVIQQIE